MSIVNCKRCGQSTDTDFEDDFLIGGQSYCEGCNDLPVIAVWFSCGEWYDDRTGKCLHDEDKKTGKRGLKSPRIFLSELPPEAKGRSMKTLKMPECGIFCEEKI